MTIKAHDPDDQAEAIVPRKRSADKPSRRKASVTAGKIQRKKQVYLSLRAFEALGVTAVKTGRTESALVDELILTHLRRYQVRDLEGGATSAESEDRQDESAA